MKVAMVLTLDPLLSSGGGLCARSHVLLMERLIGKDNVHVYTLTNSPERIAAESPNWHGYKAMNSVQRFFAAFTMQKWMSRKTEDEIAREIKKNCPDLLWVEHSVLGKFLLRGWDIPVITFWQNIEKYYSWNQVIHRGPHYLPGYWASCYNEKILARFSDRCICLNERDGKQLFQLYGRHPDLLLPISLEDRFDADAEKTVTKDKNELLFIGSNFPPNVHGLKWFLKNVMPSLTSCHLTIVGNNFELLRDQLQSENVQVVGTVEDLSPYYYRSAAMVMPILYGNGIKVKTADAMMYGKKIFASTEALEGYNTEGFSGVCRCDTAQDYIDNISAFFNDPDRQTFWPEVRQYFLSNFEIHTQEKLLKQLIDGIIKGK